MLLRDYINTEFVRTVHDNIKKNQILYNRRKDSNFTKRVIEKLPTYKFIRLEGLSREQLANLMQESKLY